MTALITDIHADQPPLHVISDNELTVAISSLSIGGAERIVLDWAHKIHPRWTVHLIVLRNRDQEWPVPDFIRVTRLENQDVIKRSSLPGQTGEARRLSQLRFFGQEIAQKTNSVCVCHLLNQRERDALISEGAQIVTVLHNAKEGWPEGSDHLAGTMHTIAVSQACADDLAENNWDGSVSIIRHIPSPQKFPQNIREDFREHCGIPKNALVIGMIGAVKAQKNYLLALRLMQRLLQQKNAYLLIIGGSIGANARKDWDAIVEEVYRLGLRDRVSMPGFIPNASLYLPAFDLMLNTSYYEGLSIATLEALISGIPVVASEVGGQGEIRSEGLTLISKEASDEEWIVDIEAKLSMKFPPPPWAGFPSLRLWTLAGLARPVKQTGKVLFVTANLNSGGAQRSMVNLAQSLKGEIDFAIAVAGNSTDAYFYGKLKELGIEVVRAAENGICFTNAETITDKICHEGIGTVCFWNLDAKVKLLLVKMLGFTNTRFIDVSPGNDSFHGIQATSDFQQLIAFSQEEYYRRLNLLVLKFHDVTPVWCNRKTIVIPNGVQTPPRAKMDYAIYGTPKIVVNGRIAPTKFLLEIIAALRLVQEKFPKAELHIFGAAEPTHKDYARQVFCAATDVPERTVIFHGKNFETTRNIPLYDAYVVLGKDQGCPNALLEALSVGMPSVGNNDGGTQEQLIHEETGLLIDDCSPKALADALIRILEDRNLAKRLGEAGRQHVLTAFSMEKMTDRYLALLRNPDHLIQIQGEEIQPVVAIA